MKRIFSSLGRQIKKVGSQAETFIKSKLSLTEQVILLSVVVVLIVSGSVLFIQTRNAFSKEIATSGGILREGIIGTRHFINPVLASTNADKDMTALVYSGLLRRGKNGNLSKDLAESFSVSEDGLEYTFTIRQEAIFHDGNPVTADDVIFTIEKIQNGLIRSPKNANWDGVEHIKIDEKTVVFRLKESYAPFIHNVTIGILPAHLWADIPNEQFAFTELNRNPVGSGPYKFERTETKETAPYEKHIFKSFPQFSLGKPKISEIHIFLYTEEDDLLNDLLKGHIDTAYSLSSEKNRLLEKKGLKINTIELPRLFGLFFNQDRQAFFLENQIRKALSVAVDREKLLQEVLFGFGQALDGPLPISLVRFEPEFRESESESDSHKTDQAKEILKSAGWTKNEEGLLEKKKNEETQVLSFTIATANVQELIDVANFLKKTYDVLGVETKIEIYETSELTQNIIRKRDFDALLFGMVVGQDADLYPFWHSSQRIDPGLNVSGYANIKTDSLLEEMRATSDSNEWSEKYQAFEKIVLEENPAVFLYAPDFTYAVSNQSIQVNLGDIDVPADRFAHIHVWTANTKRIWNIFSL